MVSREGLIETYLELSAELGVYNVTLQKTAAKAGVAFGTVRYHFNRDEGQDVVQAALMYVIGSAYKFIEDSLFTARHSKDFDPVAAYVEAMFAWMWTKKSHSSFLVYYYYLCTSNQDLEVPNSMFVERARLRIASLINEAVGMGLYPRLKDTSRLAAEVHGIVTGMCLIAVTDGGKAAFKIQKDTCLSVIQNLLK